MIPNYIRLKKILEKEIKEKFKVGDLFYSQNYLMRKYGYSGITVIRALEELEREGYIYRIKGKGTYVSRFFKEEKKEVKNIGILFSNIESLKNPGVNEFLLGIKKYSKSKNYHFVIFSLEGRSVEGKKGSLFLNSIEKRELNGVIIADFIERKDILFIKEKNIPVVLVGHGYEGLLVPYILPDFEFLGEKITEELINKGYKRIGLIIGPATQAKKLGAISLSLLFLKGYINALSKNKIPYDETIVKESNYTKKDGERCVMEILKLKEPVDSLIVIEEKTATIAKKIIGKKIFVKDTHNYNFSEEEMGKITMEIMEKLINGEEVYENRLIVPGKEMKNKTKFDINFEKNFVFERG
ncbi:MAG: GntR family transcriptional regulator [Candidatus Omnitrophica bacterium]|nr:GntR family transcriptional regulator [Candidatus Omnitrophota bacterium]